MFLYCRNKEVSKSSASGSVPIAEHRNIRSSVNSDNDAYLRYTTGSNVHSLSNKDRDSDDDDNATWNGNSTQQQ